MKERSSPYTLASSLAILLLDWTVYAFTLATYADALWPGIGLGAAIALVTVVLLEYRADDSLARALAKGLLAAAAIAAPLPLLGSLLALVCVAWSLIGRRVEPR